MNKNCKTGLVIMASGLGKRFGSNKLMERLENKPLIQWIMDTASDYFDKIVVVTRHRDIKTLCDELNTECILHDLPNRNDTVRLGLSAIMHDIDYCFFTPGDQPLIKRETVAELIDAANSEPNFIVRTCFGDNVGSPVGFPKVFFDELLKLPVGKGGGLVVKNNISNVHMVHVREEYELWDVDTVEDLEKIKNVLKNM